MPAEIAASRTQHTPKASTWIPPARGDDRVPLMTRVMNFNAGPAALPVSALERARDELLDFDGSGMSVMEHSHRGKVYERVHHEATSLVAELLGTPLDTWDVLFVQGGASMAFAQIPLNFLEAGKTADYVVTGAWG